MHEFRLTRTRSAWLTTRGCFGPPAPGAFVMEAPIDETAIAAKHDPIACRLVLLNAKHARHWAVFAANGRGLRGLTLERAA